MEIKGPPERDWWLKKPYRMVQTNLREIDATLDLDRYIQSLRSFHTEVVLFNMGGIVANYPTELPYHFRNTHMKGDFAGGVLERAHEEGIRFIARFDFSKVNEAIAKEHPEWLFKGDAGDGKAIPTVAPASDAGASGAAAVISAAAGAVNYNGQVHTCVNGKYQQECSLAILEEALSRYPVDGVFFNMIGYQTRDYSGVYHGICRCDSCVKRFRGETGKDLPAKEDFHDPVFRAYEVFRRHTSRELYHRIRETIKRHGEGLAIATYTHEGVDIFRSESNSGIDRPFPEWDYSAADNVRSVLGSFPGMAAANTAVHFIDIPYRHVGVSPHLTRARLACDIAHGGWVDYYVIGTLEGQEDRHAFGPAREVYAFHAGNDKWLAGTRPVAHLGLIRPVHSGVAGSGAEYRGLFRMLTEAHILFDVVDDTVMDKPGRLAGFKALVLPDARCLSDEDIAAVQSYVEGGGLVLATGLTATRDAHAEPRDGVALKCLGASAVRAEHGRERASYLRVSRRDKETLRGFEEIDLVHLDTPFIACEPAPAARTFLSRIPPAMFGPPEKCYYGPDTGEPGMLSVSAGKGRAVFIPWFPGASYLKYAHHGPAAVVASALHDLLGFVQRLHTDAPPLVEMALHEEMDGRWMWLGMVNHSGHLGTAYHAPLPVRDIRVSFSITPGMKVKAVRSLRRKEDLHFTLGAGEVRFTLSELGDFDVVLLDASA
jgi:hypothetical protein